MDLGTSAPESSARGSLVEQSDALHARVQAFMGASLRGRPAEPFDALAAAIARFQAEHAEPVARLFRARGLGAGAAIEGLRADDIPAVPCDVFRFTRVAAHPPELDERVFRTSGTSFGPTTRGEHPFRTTATYELSALSWAGRMLWPNRQRLQVMILAPQLAEAPDSSLGFMLDRFAAHLGGPVSWHVHGAVLDVSGFERACAEAREARLPAIVLGTSLAFVHLVEARPARDRTLPEGSRAMQTGGFKGRSREVPVRALRQTIATMLGVPEAHVVGEYGMTELSSQLYEGTLASALGAPLPGGAPSPDAGAHADGDEESLGVYHAPPWMRVTAVEPATLALLPDGEVGIARIVDLANVDSAVAVQTSDRVRVTADGVELLGRIPGATPRGCSIALDQMLEGAR